MLHPVVVDEELRLIAGQRRLEACRLLGWPDVPVRVIPLEDTLRGEFDENAVRKDFTPSEKYVITSAKEEGERRAAKQRMLAGKKQPSAMLAGGKGETRDKVAKAAGTGHTTMKKIREVCEAAEAEPEKYQPLVDEMNRTGRVAGVYKKLKVAKQVQQINTEPAKPPSGRYRVLVVDPPWSYGRAGDQSHRSANPYAQMALEDIHRLPIAEWAHDDCVLWLWTTNAFLREAFACLDAWGFEQKTVLTWVKNRMGTGDWLRGKTEHCIMAVRGKPTVSLTNQTTALLADAGEHSAKPAEFYAMVEGLCPGSKLDVFARASRNGWEVYGLEAV